MTRNRCHRRSYPSTRTICPPNRPEHVFIPWNQLRPLNLARDDFPVFPRPCKALHLLGRCAFTRVPTQRPLDAITTYVIPLRMKATALLSLLLTFLWTTAGRAEGVLFVDNYPEVVGIEVHPFASLQNTGWKTNLTDKNGQTEAIENKRIAGIVTFFDERDCADIIDESQLVPLLSQRSEIESVGAKLMEAKPYAHKAAATIDAVLSKFRSGGRKVNGKWLTAAEYQRYQSDLEAEKQAARAVIDKRIVERKAASNLRAADQAAIEKAKQADNNVPGNSSDKLLTDPHARDLAVIHFKERVAQVLIRTLREPTLTRTILALSDVDTLPPGLTTEILETATAARSFRRSVGYDIALHECAEDTAAVETLTVIDKVLTEIKAMKPSLALEHMAAYAKTYPAVQSERLRSAYQALVVLQALCLRLQGESQIHIDRAKVLAAAGKMEEAIKEYEQAVQIFPDSGTAQRIKDTRRQTLGL